MTTATVSYPVIDEGNDTRAQEPGPERWESVKGPQIVLPYDNRVQGAFHLAVDLWDLDNIWTAVKNLTIQGQLGFLCSLSPGPMMHGLLRFKWTISIHTLHRDKERTRELLEFWDLFQFTYKYDVNKRFREDLWNEEQFFNGFFRSIENDVMS